MTIRHEFYGGPCVNIFNVGSNGSLYIYSSERVLAVSVQCLSELRIYASLHLFT